MSKSLPKRKTQRQAFPPVFLTIKPACSHFYFIFLLFFFCSNRCPMCVIMASAGCTRAYATCMTNQMLSATLAATRVKRSHRRPQFIYLFICNPSWLNFDFFFLLTLCLSLLLSGTIPTVAIRCTQLVSSGGSSTQSTSILQSRNCLF